MWTLLAGWIGAVPLFSTDYAAGWLNPAFLGNREGIRMVLGGMGNLYEQTREARLYDNFDRFAGWIPTARSRVWSPWHPWIGISLERSGNGVAFQIQPEQVERVVDRSRVYAADYTLLEDREVTVTRITHRYGVAAGGRIRETFRMGAEIAYREGAQVITTTDHLTGTVVTDRQGYRGWDIRMGSALAFPGGVIWGQGQIPITQQGWEDPYKAEAGIEFTGAQVFPVHVSVTYAREWRGNTDIEHWQLVSRQAILDRYLFGIVARAVNEGAQWFPVMGVFTGYQESFWGRVGFIVGASVAALPLQDEGETRVQRSQTRVYLYGVYTLP